MVRISLELPDEVAEALSRLAGGDGATTARMLSRWVEQAVADRAELERRVVAGLADLEAGRTVAHDEVMAELESWASEVEARHRAAR